MAKDVNHVAKTDRARGRWWPPGDVVSAPFLTNQGKFTVVFHRTTNEACYGLFRDGPGEPV